MTADLMVATTLNLPPPKLAELRKIWLHATSTDANAIGWLPVKAFDIRSERDQVATIYRNSDLVGWAMYAKSRARGVMKLYQIWVRPDARIIEHGRALVAKIANIAQSQNCYMIEAWVAEDLPANLFWQAIGFAKINWRWGKSQHERRHLLWQLQIPALQTTL